ncbi:UNVERIFIED_CONTAM: hypothetical protein K2H54_052070 [Gekko kuhli]
MSPEPEPPPPPPPLPLAAPAREAEVVALTVAAAAAAAVVEGDADVAGGSDGKKWGSRIMLVGRIGFKPGGGSSVSVWRGPGVPGGKETGAHSSSFHDSGRSIKQPAEKETCTLPLLRICYPPAYPLVTPGPTKAVFNMMVLIRVLSPDRVVCCVVVEDTCAYGIFDT